MVVVAWSWCNIRWIYSKSILKPRWAVKAEKVMLKTVEQVKTERHDLVKLWSKMTKEQLYEEIFKEATDAINMETRVGVFMEECTGLSKTGYDLDVIRKLINEKQKQDISEFCTTALEDTEGMTIEEIREYLKEEVI